jgi:hypothetical protein
MKKNGRPYRLFRNMRLLVAVIIVAVVAAAASFAEAAEDSADASKSIAYFCGKRGDLTAPQCAILLGEYSMSGHKGHVFVCSKSEKVFGCVSGLCEDLTTFVSRIENNLTIDKLTQLCEFLCGPCKAGWR